MFRVSKQLVFIKNLIANNRQLHHHHHHHHQHHHHHHHHDVPTQIIKPSFPTPSHLQRYNLSSMDQFALPVYIPIIFHYPNTNTYNKFDSSSRMRDISDKSRRLKTSLSETLIQYYPFAGRLDTTGSYVHCNDQGIEFQEVSFQCGLSEILKKPDHEARAFFYPEEGLASKNNPSLLVVRLNSFECGGISIVVCLSHMLGDALSFLTFMNSWATKMRGSTSNDIDYSPRFIISDTLSNENAVTVPKFPFLKNNELVIRKIVFPNSKLSQLKAMVNESGSVENISRVDVLTALLFKCATHVNTTNLGFFQPTVLFQTVNMRPKMLPPLPETSIGNFLWPYSVPTTNESEHNLKLLAEKIKKGKMETKGMKNLDANAYASRVFEFLQNNYEPYAFSSLCGMQFYQVDFGWGTPSRVSIADAVLKNTFILSDTPKGDGIEVLVALDEHNMNAFQNNEEILEFTSSPELP